MRYTPFELMERMVEQMRRDMAEWGETVWDDRLAPLGGYGLNTHLSEHDDEFVLTVDLPGFETDEIDLRYDEGTLHLTARHEVADESTSQRRSVSERIALSREIVVEDVEANYRNGVLEVHLPIVEGSDERGHRIDVE